MEEGGGRAREGRKGAVGRDRAGWGIEIYRQSILSPWDTVTGRGLEEGGGRAREGRKGAVGRDRVGRGVAVHGQSILSPWDTVTGRGVEGGGAGQMGQAGWGRTGQGRALQCMDKLYSIRETLLQVGLGFGALDWCGDGGVEEQRKVGHPRNKYGAVHYYWSPAWDCGKVFWMCGLHGTLYCRSLPVFCSTSLFFVTA